MDQVRGTGYRNHRSENSVEASPLSPRIRRIQILPSQMVGLSSWSDHLFLSSRRSIQTTMSARRIASIGKPDVFAHSLGLSVSMPIA